MMNFMDALKIMKTGSRLMRVSWTSYWLQILPHQNFIWSIPIGGNIAQTNASIYIPTIEDLDAIDWIINIK